MMCYFLVRTPLGNSKSSNNYCILFSEATSMMESVDKLGFYTSCSGEDFVAELQQVFPFKVGLLELGIKFLGYS